MITSQTTASDSVRYLIAQHTPDPFRREPVNVGVIVQKGLEVHAKFIGEDNPGSWDSSKLRTFANPNAYKLWVDHWRDRLSQDALDAVLDDGNQSFGLIAGGYMERTDQDSVNDLCHYLYGLLVKPKGGLASALSDQEDQAAPILKNDVSSAFRDLEITPDKPYVRYPIHTGGNLKGKNRWYEVAFCQQTEKQCWAIDIVDFGIVNKRAARNHAAYAKLAFLDLAARDIEEGPPVKSIALVRFGSKDFKDDNTQTGLAILEGSCDIVDWNSRSQRNEFLQERALIATSFN